MIYILYLCAVIVAAPTFTKEISKSLRFVGEQTERQGDFAFNMGLLPHIPNNIRILKACADHIVNHQDFHELTVLFQLKALYTSNSIHNYRKRWNSLASVLGISESKLRKAVNLLKQRKLAWSERTTDREDLRLAGNETLKKLFDTNKFRKHKIKFDTNKNLETKIKAVILQQNLNRQVYVIREKIVDKLGIKRGKNRRSKEMFYTAIKNKVETLKTRPSKGFPNPVTSLSRLSIANLLNKTSSSTGHRWMNKFKQLDLIETDKRQFEFLNVPYSSYALKELTSEYGGRLRLYKGWFYKVTANEITMKCGLTA